MEQRSAAIAVSHRDPGFLIRGLTLTSHLQPVTKPIGVLPVRKPAARITVGRAALSIGILSLVIFRLCERYSIIHD